MASENETVEEALAAVRKKIHEWQFAWFWFKLYANTEVDRIESAWRREKAQVMQAATEVASAPTEVRYEPRPRRNCDRFANAEELKEFLRTHSVNRNHSIFIDGVQYSSAYVWLFAPVAEGCDK